MSAIFAASWLDFRDDRTAIIADAASQVKVRD